MPGGSGGTTLRPETLYPHATTDPSLRRARACGEVDEKGGAGTFLPPAAISTKLRPAGNGGTVLTPESPHAKTLPSLRRATVTPLPQATWTQDWPGGRKGVWLGPHWLQPQPTTTPSLRRPTVSKEPAPTPTQVRPEGSGGTLSCP